MDRYNFAGLEDGSDENDGILGNHLTDQDLLRQGLVLRSEWEFGEHLPKKHRQVLCIYRRMRERERLGEGVVRVCLYVCST